VFKVGVVILVAMPAVLKLSYQGEVRRVMMEKDVSYEDVSSAIAGAWPAMKDLTAKYTDEEGDLCVLCEASFTDFLAVSASKASEKATGQLLLRLEFVAAEPAPTKTLGSSDTAMPSSFPMNEDQGQAQSFPWHLPQYWSPHAPGHDWSHGNWGVGSWEGQHGYPGFHGHDCRGYGRGFFKTHGHGWQEHKGWEGKHGHHVEGKWGTQKQEWLLKPKKMLWLMTQLHASGALSKSAAVSLWVDLLPQAVRALAEDSEKAQKAVRKLHKKVPHAKTILQNVMVAAKQIEGLEQCETILTQLLSMMETKDPNAGVIAGELLVSLLSAVDALSFDRQVKFFETFFELQKDDLYKFLDSWKSWCPGLPVDHHGVACNGCGMSPLIGLRFKSLTCEDFDLCSECFCKRQSLPHGEAHEFKMIPLDWANMWWKKQNGMKQAWWGECKEAWKAWMMGKSKGKGKDKGKDKGKGKGKCKRSAWDADAQETPMKLGEEETVLKAQKLEEMGFGDASDMAELLKQCGGNLSKALEALQI